MIESEKLLIFLVLLRRDHLAELEKTSFAKVAPTASKTKKRGQSFRIILFHILKEINFLHFSE